MIQIQNPSGIHYIIMCVLIDVFVLLCSFVIICLLHIFVVVVFFFVANTLYRLCLLCMLSIVVNLIIIIIIMAWTKECHNYISEWFLSNYYSVKLCTIESFYCLVFQLKLIFINCCYLWVQ